MNPKQRARVLGALTALALCGALVGPNAQAATRAAEGAPASVAAADAAALPPEGSFVTARAHVWRVVGGALVWVPSWIPYGGPRPTKPLPESTVQAVITRVVHDGVFIRTIQDGGVYRMVAGMPIYVSTWAPFGGPQPTTDVDVQVVSQADGGGYPWGSVRSSPVIQSIGSVAVNRFIRGAQDGRVYALVGASPVYVSTWAVYGGPKPYINVDAVTINRAGQPGPWRFLRYYPDSSAGDVLRVAGSPPDEFYQVIGGAPVFVPTTTNWPDHILRYWQVDPASITRAGGPPPWSHLRWQPADGSFLLAWSPRPAGDPPVGTTYWITGGAAVPVRNVVDCPNGGGPAPWVDITTVTLAGTGGVWNHLAATPVPAPVPPC